MVEFFAQSCPHCQHLEPVWHKATQQWLADHPDKESGGVQWEQKECYGEGWSEGRDHDECMKEGIHSFPAIRFYSTSGSKFADFTASRTPEKLLEFAADHSRPSERPVPLEETRAEHPLLAAAVALPPAKVKVVEYVAKSCPHCQSMEPLWQDAQKQWAAENRSDVQWEQKECFGQGWAPGKDLEECKQSNIEGFPTLKIFGGTAAKAGDEFSSARSVPNILAWVRKYTGEAPADGVAAAKAAAVEASAGPLVAAGLCAPVLPSLPRKGGKASFL